LNAQSIIEPATGIVPVIEAPAQVVLFDSTKFSEFYDKLKADVQAVPIDLKTDKGRKAIASAAAKVRSEKASIDRDRKRLTQQWRDMTAQVNGAWKSIETQLDDLAVEARRPLTEWEEAEKARVEACNAIITELALAGVVTLDDTAAVVRERGAKVWAQVIDPARFGDLTQQAQQAKDHAVETLKNALARLTREEAERAELEKLRAEAAERERIEAERLATEQAAQRAAEEAQRRQEEIERAEKAEKERNARIAAEAEERAKLAAEEAAEADRKRIQREHDEALAAERRRAEEAEQAAHAERDRAAQEKADREAAEKAEAAEQAKRDKNRAHRAQVMGEAKVSIMAAAPSLDDATAVLIVKAIVAGKIPNVTLRF
jgi:hypothetical protein